MTGDGKSTESSPNSQAVSPGCESHADRKMNSSETILNLANTVLGSGILAVPYAFSLVSYWAALLLIVVVCITGFTASLIGEELKMARSKEMDAPQPTSIRDFTYLAEISFGHVGKCFVAVISLTEVWVTSVACLVMNGSNVQGLLNMNETQAVLLCTLVCSAMIFIPLRLYAYVSLVSLLALLVGSSCFLGELSTHDTAQWTYPEIELKPGLGDLFRAYGLLLFCFSGHPCLPTLHEGMRKPKRWTRCVAWFFSIAVVIYAVVGLVAYLVHGNDVHQVFTRDMHIPWLREITGSLFAVKGQLGTPLMLRVVLESLQICPGGDTKEVLRSSSLVALVILLTSASACLLAGEVAILASFVGALLINITCMVIPCVMYLRMSLQLCNWSEQPGMTKMKLLACGILVAFGLITALGGTYFAVLDMVTA